MVHHHLPLRSMSGGLAMFAAILRASSRINTVGPVLAQFFGVPGVTALNAEYDHLYRRELTDENEEGVPWTMNRPAKLNLTRRF
jgi:hypothetical protein